MTPGELRAEVVAERAAWIRDMLVGLRALPLESVEAFLADPRNPAAAESHLRRALEGLLDLGRHVLAKGFGRATDEYKEIADGLVDAGVLAEKRRQLLRDMAGYRNHQRSGSREYAFHCVRSLGLRQRGVRDDSRLREALQRMSRHPRCLRSLRHQRQRLVYRSRSAIAWSLSLAVALGSCDDSAEPRPSGPEAAPSMITGGPACPECEIVLRDVVMLGDSADPASVRDDAEGRGCMVGRLAGGEYLLTGAIGGGEIFVFDPDGHLVRTIGQPGEGPGEFGRDLRVTVGPRDTLYVMDDTHARLQVLTPAGAFVRSFAVPGAHRSFARLADGSFVFFRAPSGRGEALFHRVDADGHPLPPLGAAAMADPRMEIWMLSPGRDGGFWAASTWRYEVEQWRAADSPDRVLRRAVEWFPPLPLDGSYPSAEERRSAPRPPLFNHMHEDEAGRLWTFSWIPDAAWEPDIPMTPQNEWARRTFDTMIEVIDLESEHVIAARRYDGGLGPMCGSALMYTIEERAPGFTYVRVVQPRLVEPE